ncbi:DUF2799 domain-containing protein [Paroceanicella profunda]|nr:DUF2799 domain-containing protein [Paroceanicella profunda]
MRHMILLLFTLLTLVSGCSALPPEPLDAQSCTPQNWRNLGYEDGAAGRSRDALDRRAQQCADYGPPQDVLWDLGYNEGLLAWCTPSRAYDLGRGGRAIPVDCPPETRASFLQAYEDGRYDYYRTRPAYYGSYGVSAGPWGVSPYVGVWAPYYYRPWPSYGPGYYRPPHDGHGGHGGHGHGGGHGPGGGGGHGPGGGGGGGHGPGGGGGGGHGPGGGGGGGSGGGPKPGGKPPGVPPPLRNGPPYDTHAE